MYQRSASAPNAPNETVTYTFADQSLTPSTALGDWSQTISSGNNPLYVTSAIVFSNEASIRIVSTKWSTPTILVENGLDGKSIVVDTTSVQYRNSDSGTVVPSGSWSDIPSPVAGQYLWTKTTTTYKLAGTSTSAGSSVSYSVAYTGEDGGAGAQGMSVISITPVYYLKTTGGAPQAPTAHVTSVSTGPNQWTTVVPEYDTGATYYTCNEVLYDDNTYGTNGYVWTNVVADMGVNTAITIAKNTEEVVETYDTRIEQTEEQIEALSKEVIPLSRTLTSANSITLADPDPYPGALHKLSIYGEMSLIYPNSIGVIYGYPSVPGDNLTCGNITPSQPAPYRNSKLYPSSNTYTATLALLVNDVEYNIDINFLNYLSSETYDEFVCEEERSYIIRRVGVDEQGNKYKLTVESIEERQHVPIKVEGETTIALKSFSNMTYTAEYLIDNVYTDTFTTNWELISRINMSPEQIEIASNKISLEGKTIDLTGDTINIQSKYFNVDTDGNLVATSASLRGQIKNYSSTTGNLAVEIDNTNLNLYAWRVDGGLVGSLSSVVSSRVDKKSYDSNGNIVWNSETYNDGISLYAQPGKTVSLGYKSSSSNAINPIFSFDSSKPNSTPYIINTFNGRIFDCQLAGYTQFRGIEVENGLIKSWSFPIGFTGLIGRNSYNMLVVSNGLIVGTQ